MKVNWDITIRSHKCARTNMGSVLIQTYHTNPPNKLIDEIDIKIDSGGKMKKSGGSGGIRLR